MKPTNHVDRIRVLAGLLACGLPTLSWAQQPPTKIRQVQIRERQENGDVQLRVQAATSIEQFHYRLGSLKPKWIQRPNATSGYGGGYGGGGYAGGDYGAEGGYGGEGYAGGGYGGMGGMMGGGGMDGGMGGMMAAMMGSSDGPRQRPTLTIYALRNHVPEAAAQPTSAVTLVVEESTVRSLERTGAGMGVEGFDGGAGFGGGGYGEEGGYGDEGTEMMLGGEYGASASQKIFLPLGELASEQSQSAEGPGERAPRALRMHLDEQEYRIVRDTITQTLNKRELVDQIKSLAKSGPSGQAESKLEELERHLRETLIAEYQTQLTRQKREVTAIEQRVSRLRSELERRQAAMQRVVDVQLGNIVLEAQGLLQNP